MAMPNELVLVRHGHSEGNLVTAQSKVGNDSLYTSEFREKPVHRWRLTKEGQDQAKITGKWIIDNIGKDFDRYYVSPYARTCETAGLLGLPDAEWRIDQRLRERDWGDIGSLPRSEFRTMFPQNALIKKIDGLYWRPPGGESIADVRLRVRDFFDTLHRECEGKRVIVVTHGEFMWATRAEVEYMTDIKWIEADNDPLQKIHNAHVLQYTRINPISHDHSEHLDWTRNICPWIDNNKNISWSKIKRKRYNNKELLQKIILL
ncbi:MAG: histidine phosphatase family protein [Patescibacteria group bacterium]